jgi:hypothetical protein
MRLRSEQGGAVEVEFVIRPDDVLAFHEYVWDHQAGQAGGAGSTWAALVFVGAVLPCAGFLYVQGQLSLTGLLIPILFVVIVLLKLVFWRPVLRRQMRRNLDQKADINSKLLGWRRFKLTPEALVVATEHSNSTHAWAGFQRIEIARDRAFFFDSPTSAHVVPGRAFSDENSFKQFVETGRRYWDAARNAISEESSSSQTPPESETNIMPDERADH